MGLPTFEPRCQDHKNHKIAEDDGRPDGRQYSVLVERNADEYCEYERHKHDHHSRPGKPGLAEATRPCVPEKLFAQPDSVLGGHRVIERCRSPGCGERRFFEPARPAASVQWSARQGPPTPFFHDAVRQVNLNCGAVERRGRIPRNRWRRLPLFVRPSGKKRIGWPVLCPTNVYQSPQHRVEFKCEWLRRRLVRPSGSGVRGCRSRPQPRLPAGWSRAGR